MVDLQNFEIEANTGAPIASAAVQAFVASDVQPNVGAVVASTTTDLNGKWVLSGLASGNYDIKVTVGARQKWYKGNTKHGILHLYDDTTPEPNRNLLYNGGQDLFLERGTGVLTLPTSDPGVPNTADGWTTYVGAGDSGNAQSTTAITAPNSKSSMVVNYGRVGGQCVHYRDLPDGVWQQCKGQTIAISAQVYNLSTSSELQCFIDDGVGVTAGTVVSAVGAMSTAWAYQPISLSATRVRLGVRTNRSDSGIKSFYVDNIMADFTSVAPMFAAEPNDQALVATTARHNLIENSSLSDTGTIGGILNNIGARLRDIIGAVGNDWKDAIPNSLTGLVSALASEASTRSAADTALSTAISTEASTRTSQDALKVAKAGDIMSDALSIIKAVAGVFTSLTLSNTGSGVVTTTIRMNAGAIHNTIGLTAGSTFFFVLDNLDATALSFDGSGNLTVYGSTVWTAANDGAASALDASFWRGDTPASITVGNASALGGVAASGYAQKISGTYVGNGTPRQIFTGFAANVVIIRGLTAAETYIMIGLNNPAMRIFATGSDNRGNVRIDTGSTFLVGGAAAEANNSSLSYQWEAWN